MSYQYCKKFIDKEVKRLNEPLVLNADKFEGLDQTTLKKLQQAVDRVNVNLRKRNRILFNSQIVEQVALQVVKNENKKLLVIDEMLQKLHCITIPIVIPNLNSNRHTLDQFSELISALPESKYLFSSEEVLVSVEEAEVEEEDNEEDETGLVQDEHQTLEQVEVDPSAKYEPKRQRKAQKQLKKRILDQIKASDTGKEGLLKEYDELRSQLVDLDAQLHQKVGKLEYVRGLKRSLDQTFDLQGPLAGDISDPLKLGALDSDEEEADPSHQPNSEPDDLAKRLQKNLIYAAGSNGSEETSLYTELAKFRVLVEKLSYRLGKRL